MAVPSSDELIRLLDLKPLTVEGGYYRELYRAAGTIPAAALPKGYDSDRSFATQIYYLLPENERSCLHRVRSDETWHFYSGGPLELYEFCPDGSARKILMGPDVAGGQVFQHTVMAGVWFGAVPAKGSAYSLVGCSVAPGFEFADFELGGRADLLQSFPNYRDWVELLTPA